MRIKNIIPNPNNDPNYIWSVTIIRDDKTELQALAQTKHLTAWLEQTGQTTEFAHLFNTITSNFTEHDLYSNQLSIFDFI